MSFHKIDSRRMPFEWEKKHYVPLRTSLLILCYSGIILLKIINSSKLLYEPYLTGSRWNWCLYQQWRGSKTSCIRFWKKWKSNKLWCCQRYRSWNRSTCVQQFKQVKYYYYTRRNYTGTLEQKLSDYNIKFSLSPNF